MNPDDESKSANYLAHLEPLQPALESYCRRQLSNPSAVEDVLQEVVAKTFRDFDRYREGTNFRAWIFRYLNLEILAWRRRNRRQTEPVESEPEVSTTADFLAQMPLESLPQHPEEVLQRCDSLLAGAIRELSEAERAVLLLRAIGEFKHQEIADILEMPAGTVMSHLSRARAHVRRRLQDSPGEPS